MRIYYFGHFATGVVSGCDGRTFMVRCAYDLEFGSFPTIAGHFTTVLLDILQQMVT